MKLKKTKLCSEVKEIYDWLDSNIKNFNPQCTVCGKCCDFGTFDHKLFVTTPELLYFYKNIKNLKSMPAQICPYLENNKCTARDFRFSGCKIFFCKADSEQLNQLSEQAIKKFKALCEKYNLPYRYADLATALNSSELLDLTEE
jgi:Fe-S-cluster containining protein